MEEALLKSVTLGDHTDEAGRKGAVLNFVVMPYGSGRDGLPPYPPTYWSHGRDDVLRSTLLYESGWASAVYIAVTKMSSLSWAVKGLGLRARRAHDLLMDADGQDGYVSFLSKHLRDFLTTDNGAFIEIVRASDASGSRILGLFHLDSRRCTRTGDPDIPVIYRDKKNKQHELKAHQVIAISDMPEPGDLWFGVGYCAASRAYSAIYRQFALERYVTEKVTGRRPTSIHFVNNINEMGIRNAITTAEAENERRGYYSYLGAIIVPNIDPTATPGVATVDMVGLPEGFSSEQERRNAYLVYANAIGLDPQEVDPQLLASRALGTGAQARVIDDKASGKGLVAWRQMFTHLVNEFIIPETTSFYFRERDYRDQIQQAELEQLRTTNRKTQIDAGIITPEQALQLLVDVDDLPQEFLAQDETPIEEIGDSGNPLPKVVEGTPQQKFDEFGHPMRDQVQRQEDMAQQQALATTKKPPVKKKVKEYDLETASDILRQLNGL